MDARYQIPVMDKMFRIIEEISSSSNGLSFMEIVHTLNEPKTTVFRILATLEQRNWLEKRNDCYHLGYMFIHYGLKTLDKRTLRSAARPVMEQLTRILQQTSHLAILSGRQSLLIDVCESSRHIKPSSAIGSLLPLYCTSHGKVLLAFSVSEPLADFLESVELEKRTEHTITSLDLLRQEIEKVREQGYGMDDLEYFDDVRCIAAPVRGRDGQCVGAIGITATEKTFPRELITEYGACLIEQAGRISRQLGGMI